MPCRGQFNAPTASVLNALDVAPFSALSASVANAPSVSLFEAPVVSEISALLVSERHAPNRLKLLQMTHQMCQFFARHDTAVCSHFRQLSFQCLQLLQQWMKLEPNRSIQSAQNPTTLRATTINSRRVVLHATNPTRSPTARLRLTKNVNLVTALTKASDKKIKRRGWKSPHIKVICPSTAAPPATTGMWALLLIATTATSSTCR